MSITTTTAIQAYSNALADFQKAQTSFNKQHEQATPAKTVSPTSFSDTLQPGRQSYVSRAQQSS